MRLAVLFAFLGLLFGAHDADAGKKKKPKYKYHFEVYSVRAAEGLESDATAAVRLLEAEAAKQFAANPALVADTSKAPDPEKNPKGYKAWLKKKKLRGSYRVVVEITSYSETIEDSPKGDGSKRVVVRLELHMFGDTIPEGKMGFEGNGSSTIKQDVGKKIRDNDREYTIKSAIELAVADAIKESLDKLGQPPAKPMKK